MTLEKLLRRSVAEALLVGSFIRTMRRSGRDPVKDVESGIETIRSWTKGQWTELAIGVGLRPVDQESREQVIKLLRIHARDARRARQDSR